MKHTIKISFIFIFLALSPTFCMGMLRKKLTEEDLTPESIEVTPEGLFKKIKLYCLKAMDQHETPRRYNPLRLDTIAAKALCKQIDSEQDLEEIEKKLPSSCLEKIDFFCEDSVTGRTCLHTIQTPEKALRLLQHDPTIVSYLLTRRDKLGYTPFWHHIKNGNYAISEVLLDCMTGDEPSFIELSIKDFIQPFWYFAYLFITRRKTVLSLQSIAAKVILQSQVFSDKEPLKLLNSYKDITQNITSEFKDNTLDRNPKKFEYLANIILFDCLKATINSPIDATGKTYLYFATTVNEIELLEHLGIDPLVLDIWKDPAVNYAMKENRSLDVIDYLLKISKEAALLKFQDDEIIFNQGKPNLPTIAFILSNEKYMELLKKHKMPLMQFLY